MERKHVRAASGSFSPALASLFVVVFVGAGCGGDDDGSGAGVCNPPCPLGQVCEAQPSGVAACVTPGIGGPGVDGGVFPVVDGGPQPTPDGGLSDAGVNPGPGALGAECTQTDQCQSQVCLGNAASGVCTVSCADTPCPDGAICVNIETNEGTRSLCLPSCQSADNCQGLQTCEPLQPEGFACLPGGQLGTNCSDNTQCADQLCLLSSTDIGFCSAECDLANPLCPDGFVCQEVELTDNTTRSFCFVQCQDDAQCPDQHTCDNGFCVAF